MTTGSGSGGYSTWGELRDHLIQAFGDTPHPATEQDIIDAYELHPGAIEKAASETIAAVNTGSIRSGWGVLRKRATQITTPVANPTRSSSVDREKRINRAEQEIRNAALYIDRETELILHLHDERGLLRDYAQATFERGDTQLTITGDVALTERMLTLWRELRPLGERAEAEAIARGQADIKRRQEHPCPNPSTSPSSANTPSNTPKRSGQDAQAADAKEPSSSPSSTSPKPPANSSTNSTTQSPPQTSKPGTPHTESKPQRSATAATASATPSPEPPPNDDIPL